jgi:hypothetical protein
VFDPDIAEESGAELGDLTEGSCRGEGRQSRHDLFVTDLGRGGDRRERSSLGRNTSLVVSLKCRAERRRLVSLDRYADVASAAWATPSISQRAAPPLAASFTLILT